MRCFLVIVLVINILTVSCKEKEPDDEMFWTNPAQTDLEDIIKRGTLRAVVDNSSTSYYIYRGRRMGYEFEMLRNLSQALGVQLKLVVTDDINKAFRLLNDGKADIIAMNLEVSEERRQYADFTEPTNNVSTVLVQRVQDEVLAELSQLEGKTIHLRQGSIYKQQVEMLQDSLLLNIDVVEVQESSENLVDKVVDKEID